MTIRLKLVTLTAAAALALPVPAVAAPNACLTTKACDVASRVSVRTFENATGAEWRHERTRCHRKTNQKWWRCVTHVTGTKGYAGTIDVRVHRRTLKARVTGVGIIR